MLVATDMSITKAPGFDTRALTKEITKAADAVEYRKSLSIRAEREAMVSGKAAHASATSRADEVRTRYEILKKATA